MEDFARGSERYRWLTPTEALALLGGTAPDNTEEILGRADALDHLLLTLELNRIEGRHLRPGEAPIFSRKYDDFGFVSQFSMVPDYKGLVPEPRQGFGSQDRENLTEKLRTSKPYRDALKMMRVEAELAEEGILKGAVERVMERKTDESGFPMLYRINMSCLPKGTTDKELTDKEIDGILENLYEDERDDS